MERGIYHYRDHVGDGRLPLQPVPPARQREALDFLVEHVFGPDAFRWSPELLNKLAPERWVDFAWSVFDVTRIDYPIHDIVLRIQRRPLDRFYDPTLLSRLQDLELRYEGDETFVITTCLTSLAYGSICLFWRRYIIPFNRQYLLSI